MRVISGVTLLFLLACSSPPPDLSKCGPSDHVDPTDSAAAPDSLSLLVAKICRGEISVDSGVSALSTLHNSQPGDRTQMPDSASLRSAVHQQ
jgi:hypothetical protein